MAIDITRLLGTEGQRTRLTYDTQRRAEFKFLELFGVRESPSFEWLPSFFHKSPSGRSMTLDEIASILLRSNLVTSKKVALREAKAIVSNGSYLPDNSVIWEEVSDHPYVFKEVGINPTTNKPLYKLERA